jgi:hypothetical protein
MPAQDRTILYACGVPFEIATVSRPETLKVGDGYLVELAEGCAWRVQVAEPETPHAKRANTLFVRSNDISLLEFLDVSYAGTRGWRRLSS